MSFDYIREYSVKDYCVAQIQDCFNIKVKLSEMRSDLNKSFPFVHRFAIALYHPERNALTTHAFDEDNSSNIYNYEADFSQCNSLVELADKNQSRVINDLSVFDNCSKKHTRLIKQACFNSSFTMPLIVEGQLLGFFFANSRDKGVFCEDVTKRLELIAMVIALLLNQQLTRIQTLESTVESMKVVSEHKDPETGEHLQRMASYSLLIARELADKYNLSDAEINSLYNYSALHDVGKITIPDEILHKPSKLTEDEFDLMKVHPAQGVGLTQKLIKLYHLEDMPDIQMLLDIIHYHHEKNDGSGYPKGLTREQIPLAARIVAVADIFDALTSQRPYKKPGLMKMRLQSFLIWLKEGLSSSMALLL